MSDRPAPKFQVGEEVIVISRTGHYHFCAKVTAVIFDAVFFDGIGYEVDPDPFDHSGSLYAAWGQRLLYKKHRPSTQSFSELLQSIQQPNKVKA